MEPKCENCCFFLAREVINDLDNTVLVTNYYCLSNSYPYLKPADISGDKVADKKLCFTELPNRKD